MASWWVKRERVPINQLLFRRKYQCKNVHGRIFWLKNSTIQLQCNYRYSNTGKGMQQCVKMPAKPRKYIITSFILHCAETYICNASYQEHIWLKKWKHIFCHKIQIFLGGTLLFFVNYLCVFVTNVQIWSLAESICFKLSLSAINIRCVIGNIGEWKKLVQINWFTIKYVFKMHGVDSRYSE